MSELRARRIVRNTSLQSGGYALGLLLTVATGALATRYLGVRGYGTLSVLGVLLTVPATVVNGSLDTLAVRTLAVDRDSGGAFFRNVLALKLTLAVVLAAAASAIAWSVPVPLAIRLAVAAFGCALVASALQGTVLAADQAQQRFRLPVLVDVGTRFGGLLGLLLLVGVARPGSVETRVGLCVATSAFATVFWLAFSLLRRHRRLPIGLARDRILWRRLARDAAPLLTINLLGLINYRLDVLVAGAIAGTHTVGIYAVGTRFVDAVLPLAGFFVAACFPVLAQTAALSPEARQAQARRAAEFLLLAALPLALMGWLLAPELVRLFAGPSYAAAVTPMRLLVVSLPFSYVSTFLLYLVIAADRQRQVVWVLCASIALNLALTAALVRPYGAVGPAVSTLVSEVLGTAALLVVTRRVLGVSLTARRLLRTLTAGASAAVAGLLLAPVNDVLAAALAVPVYVAAVAALGVVRLPDLKLLAGRLA